MTTYPIAETFHSVQGEGRWTGTQMYFVRFAGCNVGRYASSRRRDTADVSAEDLPFYSSKRHAICKTYDGQEFLCDTNYHLTRRLTIGQLLEDIQGEEHVCFTGGEPFMRDMSIMISEFQRAGMMAHVETSGTQNIVIDYLFDREKLWITCSPKDGLIFDNVPWIDEWKFLIGRQFDEELFDQLCIMIDNRTPKNKEVDVYIQPINGIDAIHGANVDIAKAFVKRYPHLKLSMQLHKILGVR